MMRRTHRLAALLAATTALGSAAGAAADPAPSDPRPQPGSSPSCAALAKPAGELAALKDKLVRLVGTVHNGLDLGSLFTLYGQSQDILRNLREESGKLRGAADEVSEPDLRDATLSLASVLDEGSGFAEQMSNVGAAKPGPEEISNKVTDLSTRTANSLQRFGDSYQKTCGVDLGLKNLVALANLGGLTPGQAAPGQAAPGQAIQSQTIPGQTAPGEAIQSQTAPGQTAPGQTAPGEEPAPASAPASNKSLLAPAPVK